MHKIKLILLLILPLSVLGQDLGIIDTKTTKNPAINGTHRISTDGKNLFFRNFFGLSRKVANTDSAVFTNGIKVNSGVNNVEIDQTQIMFRRTNGTTMTLGNYRAYSHQFFTNASFSGLTQAMSINNYGQVIVGNQILDGISNPTVKFQVGATGEARQRIISQASNATIELNGATGGNISNTTGNLNYTSAGNHVFNSKVILPDSTSIGNISSTELTYLDGVTSPIQAQINSIGGNKVFYGTVDVTNAVSLTANIGDLYINTTSKAVYKKTNLSFPTGLTYIALASGTWVKLGNFSLTKNDVGLSDVDNTSDANKPISSATQTALNGKENTLTKGNITSTDLTITGGTNSIIGTGVTISLSSLGRIRHFSGAGDVTNAISLTANIGDIYFNTTNGTVYQKSNLSFPSGLTYITLASGTWVKLGDYTLDKSKVGLSNVDNTSDANKPISSATQTALDLKANITSPTFITDATTPRLKITGAGDIGKGSDLVMAGNSNDLTMHGTGKVILGTGGFQRLVVTNAGNVGVGTTAPVAKFEVSGLAGFRYNDGKQADGKYLRSNSTGVAAWDSVKVSEVFGLNTTYLPISNPTSTGTLTAPTIANSLGATFATSSGNVGIGTTSPAYKLDVKGGNASTARFDNGGQEYTEVILANNAVAKGTLLYTNSINDLSIRNKTAGTLSFGTSDITRMTMFANGRVGINTTTDAGYLLDVNGSARVVGDLSISAGNKLSLSANNLTYNTIERDVTNGGILLTANTYKTFFKDNGNVGIGTTAPNAPLQFANNTVNRKIVLYENTNNDHDFYGFGVNSGILRYQTGIGTNHVFYAGATSTTSNELMRIQSNGSVGIGTISPNASSILDITSTTKGVLFPRMTTTEISAIASPADGLTVYNTTLKAICFYDAGAAVWKRVSHSNM